MSTTGVSPPLDGVQASNLTRETQFPAPSPEGTLRKWLSKQLFQSRRLILPLRSMVSLVLLFNLLHARAVATEDGVCEVAIDTENEYCLCALETGRRVSLISHYKHQYCSGCTRQYFPAHAVQCHEIGFSRTRCLRSLVRFLTRYWSAVHRVLLGSGST